VELKSPLLEDLADYSRYVMFVAIIFDLVAILLVIISVLLIYSLLVINVETKTFDIGVQRMVGLTRRGLILMVLIQGVLFVVPALVSAFLVSIPALMAFQ
jgi:ABC-type antimicrobial peptide transport system permease subunit